MGTASRAQYPNIVVEYSGDVTGRSSVARPTPVTKRTAALGAANKATRQDRPERMDRLEGRATSSTRRPVASAASPGADTRSSRTARPRVTAAPAIWSTLFCAARRRDRASGLAVGITTGVKLRGPERSEGHVSFNSRVIPRRVQSRGGLQILSDNSRMLRGDPQQRQRRTFRRTAPLLPIA
jgi:hypothetical protein